MLLAGVACSRRPDAAAPAAASGAAPAQPLHPGGGTVPHGDHNPHHGGIVMMKGDLHYEVVLDRTGRAHQLYFSDAVREDLPASIASRATLTIKRLNERAETIALAIDDAGESWIGSGTAVNDPNRTSVTLAFTIKDEPYSIDLPFALPPR